MSLQQNQTGPGTTTGVARRGCIAVRGTDVDVSELMMVPPVEVSVGRYHGDVTVGVDGRGVDGRTAPALS